MSVSTAHIVIGLLNALVALVSGVSGVVGLARPALGLAAGESVNSGVVFFARAYAVRAVPLSLVVLVLLAAGSWGSLGPVLIVAGLAQLGDAAIGAARRNTGTLITAGALAAVHLVSAQWLLAH
ncbi:hypothetical protein J2Z21_001582 [Streptomyces griseochromogenes]|nr:hypothetical protein [Streptomyces griseochromogenes]MBP2048657.1 hypothetical protein [Streptomyces griseochromogenes]